MKYKRNPEYAKGQLAVNSAGQLICKSECQIHIPIRFKDKGLAEVGIRTFAYGFFPIIFGTGDYCVINVTALIELEPGKTTSTVIDDVEYYVFHFAKNAVVFKTMDVLKNGGVMFNVFDEFVFLGKIPWYAHYDDIGKLFDTSIEYAGSGVGEFPEVIELIASMIGRKAGKLSEYARVGITSYDQTSDEKVAFVPLKSVHYSVTNTLNKLAGSYMSAGIDSAIVAPNTSSGKIETILRA